jgi:hypothetical protein
MTQLYSGLVMQPLSLYCEQIRGARWLMRAHLHHGSEPEVIDRSQTVCRLF